MKVPLSEQIEALEGCLPMGPSTFEPYIGLDGYKAIAAALATLKWVERHQAELRVLGEFPGAEIRVLTPSDHGSSAIAQGRDEVTMAVVHAACAVVAADTYRHPVLSRADAVATGVAALHDVVDRWHAAQPACNASAHADKASAVSEPVNSKCEAVNTQSRGEE
jgi:hypothetical protein